MTPATSASAAPRRPHLPRLDAIRGIAIIMVVFYHAFMFDPTTFGGRILSGFINGFSQGVPLFFVLSGFLISLIVFETPGRFPWPHYLVRRGAKIIPPFVLSLAVFALKDFRGKSATEGFQLALANLGTLPNFLFHWRLLNPVAWSLLVEIHFYLLLPALFLLWRRLAPRRAELLTIGTFVLVPVLARLAAWNLPAASAGERFFLVNRFPAALDFFSWGMVFCFLFRHRQDQGWWRDHARDLARWSLPVLGIFLLAYAVLPLGFDTGLVLEHGGAYESARFMICAVAFGMLFCIWPDGAARGIAAGIFDSRPLQYAGLVSYEWFLFHLAVIPSARFHLGRLLSLPDHLPAETAWSARQLGPFILLNLICIGVSFAAAAALYHFYSQPLLKRGRMTRLAKPG